MEFTKLHGLGNDYLYLNAFAQDLSAWDLAKLSRLVSDRHFGLGSDGIILVEPSERADFRMRIFNSDGSEAEMCGNGVRAFGKYVFDHGLTAATELDVETAAGLIHLWLTVADGQVATVRVNLGPPRLTRGEIPMTGDPAEGPVVNLPLSVGGHDLALTCVSMGNPHCVSFWPDVENAPVHTLGPQLEHHELFPRRTNVEFVHVVRPDYLEMRVWERGAGETLACGTGAAASLVAAVLTGQAERQVRMKLLGGELELAWAEDNDVYLNGPAAEVYTAEVRPELIAPARLA